MVETARPTSDWPATGYFTFSCLWTFSFSITSLPCLSPLVPSPHSLFFSLSTIFTPFFYILFLLPLHTKAGVLGIQFPIFCSDLTLYSFLDNFSELKVKHPMPDSCSPATAPAPTQLPLAPVPSSSGFQPAVVQARQLRGLSIGSRDGCPGLTEAGEFPY